MRFGFDGEPQTYDEMGLAFGVSRERVRQIEAQALRKLKHPARVNILQGIRPLKVPASMLPSHASVALEDGVPC